MIRWVNRPRKASAKAYWQNPTWTTRWRRWNRRWWREREKESATSARARWCWSFGGNFEPLLCDQNLASHDTRIDLSLFLSSLKGFKARERGTRERRVRCFGENDFVFRLSLWTLFFKFLFPSNHHLSRTTHKTKAHSERKCLAWCKMRDTKSTPKLLHANKKTKRAWQYRTVCTSENIFITYEFLLTRVKVCVFMTFLYARREGGDYFLFPLRGEKSLIRFLRDSSPIRV